VTTDKDRVLRGGWREIKLYVYVRRLSGIEKFKGEREF